MSKHYKKAIVYPERAREWLARYESGEALKTIAHVDHFDIRTVKRQVEEATSERMMNEVRQSVLRTALEKHFSDFVTLAERMRSMVKAGSPIFLDHDAIPLLNGLKQHLPRSPLWEYLGKYQTKIGKIVELENVGEDRGKNAPELSPDSRKRLNNIMYNAREANDPDLLIQARSQMRANSDVDSPVTSNPSLRILFTSQDFAVGEAKTTITEGANNPLKIDADMKRLQRNLKDELTTIVLRRVVPGRCSYCPL